MRMNSKKAAEYLGYSEITIRMARTSGKLAGITGPLYIKKGNRIFYELEDLDSWESQFRKISNTAQSSI